MPRSKLKGRDILRAALQATATGLRTYGKQKQLQAEQVEEDRNREIRNAYTQALTQQLLGNIEESRIDREVKKAKAHTFRQPFSARLGTGAPAISPTKLEEARRRFKKVPTPKAPAPTYRPDLIEAIFTNPEVAVQASQNLKNFSSLMGVAEDAGFVKKVDRAKPLTPADKKLVWDELDAFLGERRDELTPEELASEINALGRQRHPDRWTDYPVPSVKLLKRKYWANKRVPTFIPQNTIEQLKAKGYSDAEIEEAMK